MMSSPTRAVKGACSLIRDGRRIWRGLACTLCAAALTMTTAHPAQPQSNGVAASATRQVPVVELGNSTVDLTGPWKFHTGDDMAWAQPGFDDRSWGTMDLTPPPGSIDPMIGSSGYVPGWTTRGYAGYAGYAWYRLTVNVQDNTGDSGHEPLAIKMPDNFDDAYQVYVNGRLVGEFGKFSSQNVTAYAAQPRAFPLPADVRNGPVTIAIRMWMDAFTPMVDPDVGGLHGPPSLGEAVSIDRLLKLDWDTIDRSMDSEFVLATVVFLALLLSLGLYVLDRKEPAYLCLGLTCFLELALLALLITINYSTFLEDNIFLVQDAVLSPVYIGLWVIFWTYWFRLERVDRVHRMVWSVVLLLGATMAMLRAPLYGSVVPVHAIVWLSPVTIVLKLLLGALLIWVTIAGIRKDKAEGWAALPAVLLIIISIYYQEFLILHMPAKFYPFGTAVDLRQMGTILSLGIISVLLVRRFVRSQREQEHWKLEIAQAREVQQVLIPEATPTLPGFALESEYRPAQQVGGDFFQILQDGAGGALLVIGDVTGKGLQAGMLVSLLVGAIRTVAETSFEPRDMLEALNRRLCGRNQAHATCLAMRLDREGHVTIANAGHLAPYLNGAEIEMDGSLPLGMTESARFEETRLTLKPGDRLTAMTDGVVEATNGKRELFGFERARAASTQTAVEIAQAAQEFGQDDDITVLSIERLAAKASASATVPLTTRPAEA